MQQAGSDYHCLDYNKKTGFLSTHLKNNDDEFRKKPNYFLEVFGSGFMGNFFGSYPDEPEPEEIVEEVEVFNCEEGDEECEAAKAADVEEKLEEAKLAEEEAAAAEAAGEEEETAEDEDAGAGRMLLWKPELLEYRFFRFQPTETNSKNDDFRFVPGNIKLVAFNNLNNRENIDPQTIEEFVLMGAVNSTTVIGIASIITASLLSF